MKRGYNFELTNDCEKAVNDLIDARGILELTAFISVAMQARENANRIAGNSDKAVKACRISQIYKDAVKRIEII